MPSDAWIKLRDEIINKAVVRGKVILSSGREADYYVDLRRVTLDGVAAPLVGRVMRELTADWDYSAVGGLTLGADPVATAMLHDSAAARRSARCVRRSQGGEGPRPAASSRRTRRRRTIGARCRGHVHHRSVGAHRRRCAWRLRERPWSVSRSSSIAVRARRSSERGLDLPRGVLARRPRPRLAGQAVAGFLSRHGAIAPVADVLDDRSGITLMKTTRIRINSMFFFTNSMLPRK